MFERFEKGDRKFVKTASNPSTRSSEIERLNTRRKLLFVSMLIVPALPLTVRSVFGDSFLDIEWWRMLILGILLFFVGIDIQLKILKAFEQFDRRDGSD